MKQFLRLLEQLNIQKILIIFCALSVMTFADSYLISIGSYPISEFLLSTVWFAVVLITQGVLISLASKQTKIFAIAMSLSFLLGNCVYFTFFSSSWSVSELIGYSLIYVVPFILCLLTSRHKKLLTVFVLIKVIASVGVYSNIENKQAAARSEVIGVTNVVNQRNIYLIGFDSLVSRKALNEIFDMKKSPAYEWLELNGFELKDTRSAGDQTLTTYGAILSLSTDVHPRTVRRLFNGSQSSPLYELLKSSGYKIQFNYDNDYFGTGPGKIDLFYPESADNKFCEYKDKRWGYHACSFFKKTNIDAENKLDAKLEENIQKYLQTIAKRSHGKWFSIVHFWYPGHTIGDYEYNKNFEDFKRYYKHSQIELKKAFERLNTEIKARDPTAIIVFHGDHGAYAYRGRDMSGDKQDQYIFDLDSKSVLFAAPKDINYCVNRYHSQILNYISGMVICNQN